MVVFRYLTLVESLPTYGVHYYEVKVSVVRVCSAELIATVARLDSTNCDVALQDKQGMPWWLGISYKGIGQYDLQDKLKPRKVIKITSIFYRFSNVIAKKRSR